MMKEVARLHVRALPHTSSSKRGVGYVENLYKLVGRLGFVTVAKKEGKTVGAMAGLGRWILTLVVDPDWQRKGVGSKLLSELPGRRYVYTEECSQGFYEKLGFRPMLRLGKLIFLCRK